jgi:hypothetical protein
MYVLQFLEKAGANSPASAETVEVEYRLLNKAGESWQYVPVLAQ